MKTIPPAETFIINKLDETQPNSNKPPTPKQVEEWMVEFAQMHVKEALDNVVKKAEILVNRSMVNGIDYSKHYINSKSVYNAYPLEAVE